MHKVFVSYHHNNDQYYKDLLVEMAYRHRVFTDRSVDKGNVDDLLPDERIRQIIRDNYLRDSTVTVVLVGQDTRRRKHVDWEIYSNMLDGKVNKRPGIQVVNLPGTSDLAIAPRVIEKRIVYPDVDPGSWISIQSRAEYERLYPHMPALITDNLLMHEARISVAPWARIASSPRLLGWLVEAAFQDRAHCTYDLSRRMRRANP